MSKAALAGAVSISAETGADLGGDEGDRTLDLRIANATLSQLSYVPGALKL